MHVLIVENEHRLATSLRRALSESGMSADVAHDGEEGLEAASAGHYDVIVLEAMLPLINGRQVARELRDRRVHTPILLLTAVDAIDDGVAALDADDYLVKPFSQRELLARIRALSRRQTVSRPAELRAGSILLDPAAHTLYVGDRRVELTGKELSILEFFMLNRGRLLSRSQIIEHVWDYDFDGGRNLIEVYVGRLRRKLMDAGVGDPFVTVRGAGYRFEVQE
jgi:DNA-binding response OmpR family regulator